MNEISLEEAMKKVKYPQDKIYDPDNPYKMAFNDGWNALYHQLMMILKKHASKKQVSFSKGYKGKTELILQSLNEARNK